MVTIYTLGQVKGQLISEVFFFVLFSSLPKNKQKTFVLVARDNFSKHFVPFLEDLRTITIASEII